MTRWLCCQSLAKTSPTQQASLDTRAPADGVVVDLDPTLAPAEWVAPDTRVATLIDPRHAVVEAYVSEADIGRFRAGAAGRFVPDEASAPAVRVRVEAIDRNAVRSLRTASLSSLAHGSIPVIQSRDQTLIPQIAVYRVLLAPQGASPPALVQLRGKVLLDSKPRSLAGAAWRQVAGLFIRESGF